MNIFTGTLKNNNNNYNYKILCPTHKSLFNFIFKRVIQSIYNLLVKQERRNQTVKYIMFYIADMEALLMKRLINTDDDPDNPAAASLIHIFD